MKLEIGGGTRQKGEGYVNMDLTPNADIVHDIMQCPWPIPDNAVVDVYSCHCLEHLEHPYKVFHELCRVCVLGAPIELRMPHPLAELAMVPGHKCVFSPLMMINNEKYFPRDLWTDPKRMKLIRWEAFPTELLDKAKRELPFIQGLSDQVIMEWIPRTAHEYRYWYTVVENEYYNKDS